MKSLIKIIFNAGFIILLSICALNGSYAQKHTFTNNLSIFKDIATGELTDSTDIDSITIGNLGKGFYSFSDSKETSTFKFGHIENGIYVYKKIDEA